MMELPEDGIPDSCKFQLNFARLSLITRKVYNVICAQDQWICEKLPAEFLDYYVTALLWARLLHIKRQYSFTPLTLAENLYSRYFKSRVLNVPEPIYNILSMIGTVNNLHRGCKLYLSDHTLPVTVIGSKGGYHARQINSNNHCLFEEVPSLGVSGDCIMCMARDQDPVEPKFPFLPFSAKPTFPFLPAMMVATENMVGYFGRASLLTGPVREVLASLSISNIDFKENVKGTRLNIHLIEHVSTTIQPLTAFRLKKFCAGQMDIDGSETQVIETHPTVTDGFEAFFKSWTQRVVHPLTPLLFNPECLEASYYTGFQLYKEIDEKSHVNWSCVSVTGVEDRDAPNEWIQTRNSRRETVPGLWGEPIEPGPSRDQSDATEMYCEKYRLKIHEE